MNNKIYIFMHSLHDGGAERVCVNFSNYLVSKGWIVNLVTFKRLDSELESTLDSKVNFMPLGIPNTRSSLFKLKQFIDDFKPERILVFNQQIAVMLILIRMLYKKDFYLVGRNINYLTKQRMTKNFWYRIVINSFIKFLYKRIDKLISQSQLMADDLIENYDFSKDKVVIINNPIGEKIEKHKKVLNKERKDYMLFVGRLEEQKGLEYLIEAFSIFHKENKDIKLKILGRGSQEDLVNTLIKNYSLEKYIIVEGFKSDVITYYENARLVVLSSRYEGFPNVLLESIALGTPIVSFDCPSGPSEIIIEGKNGYLADYLDVNDLANKMLKAIDTKWDSDTIVKSSNKYSRGNIFKQYLELIKGG